MIKVFSASVLVFLVAFVGVAFAGNATTGEGGSLLDYAAPVLDAVLTKNPGVAAVFALVFAVAAARKYGARWVPWLGTDSGGVVSLMVMSVLGAVAAALKTGAAISWPLMVTAFGVALTAAGGWKAVKALVVDPLLGPLAEKYPWLKPVKALLDFLFRKPVDPKAAGDAAVAANPPTGAPTKFRDVK